MAKSNSGGYRTASPKTHTPPPLQKAPYQKSKPGYVPRPGVKAPSY